MREMTEGYMKILMIVIAIAFGLFLPETPARAGQLTDCNLNCPGQGSGVTCTRNGNTVTCR